MRPVEDLTARARIRDAALSLFAEHGVAGTSMRRIADHAGVSLALVQYHFGNKAGLERGCDEYVVEFIRAALSRGVDGKQLDNAEFVEETHRAGAPVLRYLGRALADGTPAAGSLFDELVAITERYRESQADPRAEAAVFVAMRLGIYVLQDHLTRALGVDAFGPEGMARIAAAQLAIISPEFAGPEMMEKARAGLRKRRRP
ncbi:TetR/AcrR family transcriptional regulator [Amycolatopsis sp. K13G38]|uniref:TetR/AcrR family transcriptional regulator n=1 Tax=Amycolatopsis acididurans TaxID=2724524 RepID=A0ABX1JB59_9PSEU|nr:TetR/AcrR family transcriptional regulator [Amycolatopsis acididurans]NKQ57030.1 TetR/AcrR family transcriptional regulator [Amycolatopsis acididurans]